MTRREFLRGMTAAGAAGPAVWLAGCATPTHARAGRDRIRAENERAGSSDWLLERTEVDPETKYRCRRIEGYCTRTSVRPGDSLEIFVSTDPASSFFIDLFRLGFYGGAGGRFVSRLGPFSGGPQPDPPLGPERVRECRWTAATRLRIPRDWLSGVYLGKLTAEREGWQSYVIFVVRDDRRCDFLFQCSDTTWAAYNRWPDLFSLYDDGTPPHNWYVGPGVRVSWDRPYGKYRQIFDAPLSQGSGEFLLWEFPLAFWMEREGYDVSYISNLDTHTDPKGLLRARAFLSVGHDEYWSIEMFDHVRAAVAAGVNAAFLSGNACDGLIEFHPSAAGAGLRSLSRIGKFGPTDRELREFGGRWKRHGPNPALLMGARSTFPYNGGADWTCARQEHWLFEGTGMRNGESIPGLVGWEHHGDPADIPGLEILARGPVYSQGRPQGVDYTATIYPAPKGNWVFNAATIWWSDGLSAPPGYLRPTAHGSTPPGPDPRVQRMTANLFGRFISGILGLALATIVGPSVRAADPPTVNYDLILRGGTVYDGRGRSPVNGDVAINGDRIAAVGQLRQARGKTELDLGGLAVAPGFINVLSWATESLLEDGRSLSDVLQGVTLEVMGEGESMGPLNESMKKELKEQQGDIQYEIQWTTLGQYLEHLVRRGVSCNVASFVGATTVRVHEIGYADRAPSPAELDRMQALVRQAMEEGALGVGSSLIYAPAFYARTDELVALGRAAAEYGGLYISHLRSEGNRFLEALEELITISREARIPAEVYHLKAAGRANWPKLELAIKRIEQARNEGLAITADMYTYTAGATGLDAAMPPWVQEGGYKAWAERLKDPMIRQRVRREMTSPTDEWENFFIAAGSPDRILLVGFKNPQLKALTGKSLAEVARARGKSPEETAMDLVIEDGSRVGTVYFLMSEENVRRQIQLPWVSFGSDAASLAAEGVFLKSNPHPRAYGNFARLLGKYVRQEKLISLEEAIRRLTTLPAANLKLKDRGTLRPGHFADVVVFDPGRIQDHATFEKPHQYAAGMVHVWVNGVQVLKEGKHTGAKPGRVVRGPGWKGGN